MTKELTLSVIRKVTIKEDKLSDFLNAQKKAKQPLKLFGYLQYAS